MDRNNRKIIKGAIMGALFPILFFIVYKMYHFASLTLKEYIEALENKALFIKLLSLGVTTNLIPFFLFLRFNRLFIVKGILSITILYAVVVLVIKIFI